MDLDVGCSFLFNVPVATHAVMMIEPHSTDIEMVAHSKLQIMQAATVLASSPYVDSFGNNCRRATFSAGPAEVRFMARVGVSEEPDDAAESAELLAPHELPHEVLQFVLPSRYCESDQLAELAWQTFGSTAPGWKRVQAICDWVHDRLTFRYGSSSPSTSALTVLEQRVGVCRDFTHLAIGLCRAFNIPTRYVFGYLPDIGVPDPGAPMDFCAWMEVFLGGRWFTFDPRNNQRRIGRVVVGRGRDAADVAMVTSFGPIELVDMTVRAEIGAGPSWNDPTRLGRIECPT